MSPTQATTAPFPRTGRPVLWSPHPRAALTLLFVLLGLFGAPPATPVMATAGPGEWVKPVDGAVVEEFAAPPAPWAAGHRGIDLAASPGEQIRAPHRGMVSFSGQVVDRHVLSIDHGSGYLSSFEPVDTELTPGDEVTAGQPIAELGTYDDGAAHCSDQPCLHWGVRLHGEYINPLLLTGRLEPSILLPLNDG